MNNTISNAVMGGLSKDDAEYIYKLDNKTKQEVLSLMDSISELSFGHWGMLRDFDLSLKDKKLSKILIDNTNLNLSSRLFRVSYHVNLMDAGLTRTLLRIITFPATMLRSPFTAMHAIRSLLKPSK